MEKFVKLFDEFLLKAITMTENVVAQDVNDMKLEEFTANRERLLQIIDQISRQVDWNMITNEAREELNRRMDYIKKLDEKLVVKLQVHQEEVRQEIERTHRQGLNIKGYNLNEVK